MKTIAQTVANLEAWLESVMAPGGYGGPVVHWWQHCLQYTGPGLDWRYEGILHGYITLWERTRESVWLEKACRAGDTLVNGQLDNGTYRNSSFELNPYPGGTPHEAAADLGLLALSLALRGRADARWETYLKAAERNLRCFFIETLWDQQNGRFRDAISYDSFVPNKACTLAEALFALAALRRDEQYIEQFALPTLRAVRKLQVRENGRLQGGIPQSQQQGKTVPAYFPYYVARCIPALLTAYQYTGEEDWLEAAVSAYQFILRFVEPEGYLPQVIYAHGVNRYPQWVAPLGDLLRVAQLLQPFGVDPLPETVQLVLLNGQLPTGGIVTGRLFDAQISQIKTAVHPDFRDQIPVAGWVDKAFRYLTTLLPAKQHLPAPRVADWQIRVHVRGRRAMWLETHSEMRLFTPQRTIYQWRKGESWTAVSEPEVLWK